MFSTIDIIIRLSLSCLLGGLIGIERESLNRPAGFRTHILVCIGSTLIMLVNLYLFQSYKTYANIDPARLGAQVISGIGFLGAGTIIREGSSVKGLTTAAGLWAVAGIGIAIGSGFYMGAIATTVIVLVTLIIFSKFERNFIPRFDHTAAIQVISIDKPGQIGKIGTTLGDLNVAIKNISMAPIDDVFISIQLQLSIPKKTSKSAIIENLLSLDGVTNVETSKGIL
ncbi:putative Mg2+ transporter-C (MgtC) family protein [Anaerosolibacter carboniphilus]|uniref:Putative Mg2+ transporter-C (MgtC) family protein n=1 Tax=Anaerosolibacter carboniphilus TaxID=1417629 RepID=A0A841KQR5_9FIRM|nr:MgtC/SapB family protein [Anaerosolibacter carboniphilus]MBB6215691.1 putative Mg2+ transporter-C (MgtC) family protein [Anaerosolibacter carboniphilus]